jgi:nucleoredoxin
MRYLSCLSLLLVSLATAGTLPLTVSEIGLMLRTGYSSAAVEKELAARHFADTLDEAKRKALLNAGATPQLLDALSSGKFTAPQEEIEKARQQREEQIRQRALATEREKKLDVNLNGRGDSPESPARMPRAQKPVAETISPLLKGKLVRCRNGLLTSYYDEELNGKRIYGLYFSAHWCPPCRKFTPQLIEYYNKIVRDHPEFEIIFLSADKTVDAMAGYMRDTGMPWPAIDYAKLKSVPELVKYAGKGIPDLVIIDSSGKVLADSYVNGNYVGPAQVLADLDTFFANGSAQRLTTR